MRKRARVRRAYTIGVATFALALLLYAVQVAPPQALLRAAPSMLGSAAVGITVGVAENPYNRLAQQLEAKEDELAAREQRLSGADRGPTEGFFDERMAVISFCISIALFVLLILNFYFDWHRERRKKLEMQRA